jgi:hypothetical protein
LLLTSEAVGRENNAGVRGDLSNREVVAMTRPEYLRDLRAWAATTCFALAVAVLSTQMAFAIRQVARGNTPMKDPGWPKGAAAVFNNQARTSHLVGPDHGYYTAEYIGDATTLGTVLADFASVKANSRRLVVRDGVRSSAFKHKIDWVFNVWVPMAWERPTGGAVTRTFFRDPDECPSPEIIVYTGGNVRWSEVAVPTGIKVIDERLEAHGFPLADGIVLEGKVVDLATQQPIIARISALAPTSKGEGADDYLTLVETVTDAEGRWVLKNVPADCRRLMLAADGYMTRLVYNPNTDGQPRWQFFQRGLSRPVVVSGRSLHNTNGQPLANVEVRLEGDASHATSDYWRTRKYVTTTDPDGHFRFDDVPSGNATIRVRHSGYCLQGATRHITTPAEDIVLDLVDSAEVRVTVDFIETERPDTYLVAIRSAEGGVALPTWEQFQNHVVLVHNDHFAVDGIRVEIRPIDADHQVSFTGVSPGRYILEGWPSRFGPGGRSTPFSGIQRSKPLAIDVKSGQTVEITLPAQ